MEKIEPVKLPKKERKKFYQDLQREEARKLEWKHKVTKFGGIGLSAVLVLVGGYFLSKELTRSIPKMGEVLGIQGAQHIQPGTEHESYNSNPPSSGPHYGQTAEWGVYGEQLPDEQLIHNLEHGGIWISYKPDLDKGSKEKLINLAKGYKSKVVLEPRKENDSNIALVSWGRVFKLESFDEQQIKDFIEFYKNKGPEKVPD